MAKMFPAVSVVVPMYNAEEFIGECLDSLLAQTLPNFEVIIVDDRSTDTSPAVVANYVPRFGGRLRYFRLQKNSGGAGIPRNKGISFARGKYIFFMDADDRIAPEALADDFKLAQEFDADVIYHTRYYKLSGDGTQSELANVPKYREGDEIVLDDDLTERVKDIARNKYWLGPWRSFSRRDFLIANEIFFPNIRPYEDLVWSHALLIYAQRLLRVPTAVYFYRDNESSMTRISKSSDASAKFYLNPIILGLKSLDTFISRHEFFKTKPQLHYALLENFFNGRFTSIFRDSSEFLPPFELYEAIKDEFGDTLGDRDVLIAALCTALVQQQQVTAAKLQQFKEYQIQSGTRIAELENEINLRKI